MSSESFEPGLVSIVIPTYNRASLLSDCIDSALAQDYSNHEVIVVDDGSIDSTRAVCDGYGDKIRYFWKPNGGVASALNFGIGRMRGEWLKVVGSDDVLESNALSAFVKSAKRLNARWLACDYTVTDVWGKQIRFKRYALRLEGDALLRALWCGAESDIDRMFGGAVSGYGFLHRSLLTEVGLLDETVRVGEDWEWALRATFVYGHREVHIPLTLYRVRLHRGQMTGSMRKRFKRWDIRGTEGAGYVRSLLKRRLNNPDATLLPRVEHYRAEAKRLRREYLPLMLFANLRRGVPLYNTIRHWVWVIAPTIMDQIYWAYNPPVDIRIR
jgi:glycosyltransferase involved in cell wall biosynthesis